MYTELSDNQYNADDAFFGMLIRELTEHNASRWDWASGGVNLVAVVTYGPPGIDNPDIRIVKVPIDDKLAYRDGRAEIATLRLVAATDPPPPFEVPAVDRIEEDFFYAEEVIKGSFYFVLTPVHGMAVNSPEELSVAEAQEVGRATASISMWEESIDLGRFIEEIERPYGSWDWHTSFAALEFSDTDYPSLSVAASKMRLLRDQYYPSNRSSDMDTQVIQGDLRLPNLSLSGKSGKRVVSGVLDWGSARKGTRAEECRSLWEIGRGAIEAANKEFELSHRSPVDPEEVRFWFLGRFVAALIQQLQNGIPTPKAYARARSVVQKELPGYDWAELPNVTVPTYYSEGGRQPRPNFNGVHGMDAVQGHLS